MESNQPTIVVRKGGFFTALVRGIFGLAMTLVICATLLAGFALQIVNTKSDSAVDLVNNVLGHLPEWQQALPPVWSDALQDRQAIELAGDLRIETELIERSGSHYVVVKVDNRAQADLSMLTLDVVISDNGVPVEDFRTHVVTPIAVGDWRGPLPRDREREYARRVRLPHELRGPISIKATPIELRVRDDQPQLPAPPVPTVAERT